MFFCCCAAEPAGADNAKVIGVMAEEGKSAEKEIAPVEIVEEKKEESKTEPLQEEQKEEPKDKEEPKAPEPALEEKQPPKPKRFEIVLEKTSATQPCGLSLDTRDESALEIVKMSSELIDSYNAKAEDSKKIVAGLYILSINGKSGNASEMITELKTQTKLTLQLACKETFTVTIPKGSESLGAHLKYEPTSSTLVVNKIDNGALQKYNASAPSNLQIVAKDRIVEVNGVSGSAAKMVESLKASADVKVVVERPAQ